MPYEIPDAAARKVWNAFQRVIDTAIPSEQFDQFRLFAGDTEEFIRREVERKLAIPMLPHGGGKQRDIVDRLNALALDYEWTGASTARIAARRWSDILGWYYWVNPLSQRTNKELFLEMKFLRETAAGAQNWERKWFAELMLENGWPERVADFELECLYLLERPDGATDRLVRLTNVLGETKGPVVMTTDAFHAPQKFREWCLRQGNFVWAAGEKQLQALHHDVSRASAWRKVTEVVSFGWHPLAAKRLPSGAVQLRGIWFYQDGAYAEGRRLIPDADGVYWFEGEGYLMAEEGRENAFHQKQPRMHPELAVTHCQLAPGPEGTVPTTEPEILRELFTQMCDRLQRILGGMEAYIPIGSFLSFAAAPELFDDYSLFPGVWVHGLAGSGKSTIIEWMMEIWGFNLHSGLLLRSNSMTAVGLLQAADQYSNLPVWVDEYRMGEVDEAKTSILHNAFNRGGQAKFNPQRLQRVMRTTFAVGGESTSADAALRGRYAHVQVSASKREKDEHGEDVPHAKWFAAHRRWFFLLGRFLMEHRAAFVALVRSQLNHWMEAMPNATARDKLVYGVPYAAFVAMSALLESHTAPEVEEFRDFLRAYTATAGAEVASELNVNVFIGDMINAWKAGAITAECFRLRWKRTEHPPGSPNQGAWDAMELYFDPGAVMPAMQIWLTKQRKFITLRRRDLQAQLSKMPFWIDGRNYMRYTSGEDGSMGATVLSWGFRLDQVPELGYRPIADAEYDEYRTHPDRGDPRQGELFIIAEAVKRMELKRSNLNIT